MAAMKLVISIYCLISLNPLGIVKGKPSEGSAISYGGILNKWNSLSSEARCIQRAAKFAYKATRKTFPMTLPPVEKDAEKYHIANPARLKLVFTQNDRRAFILQRKSPDQQAVDEFPLEWGDTYSFTLSWPHLENQTQNILHNYVVTEHDEKMYLYQHTFHDTNSFPNKVKNNNVQSKHGSSMENCDSDINCDRQHNEHSNSFDQCSKSSATEDCKSNLNSDMWTSKQGNTHDDSRKLTNSGEKVKTPQKHMENIQQLKILTYNIWNVNRAEEDEGSSYIKRIQQLGKLVMASGADIIGFQEVRFQEGACGHLGPCQAQHLATLLPGYQYVYQPAQIQTNEIPDRVEEGVAIFSRFPILRHKYLLLKRNVDDGADGHQRVLLHVEIKTPIYGNVHVLTTHLSLSHLARSLSVRQIWQYIQRLEGPVFLTGDFNAEIHNEEIKFLDGHSTIHGTSTRGFHDTWLLHHGSKNKGFTFSTLEPGLTKRLDMIFIRDHPSVRLHAVELLDDEKRKLKASTDHLGVIATVLLEKQKEH